jgi:hypothetical protein
MKTLITEYRTDNRQYTVQIFKTDTGWRVENSIGEAHDFLTEGESESFSEGWIHNQNYLPTTVELEPTSLRMRK